MTTEYAATVRVEDGTLTVTRPHPSIGPVDDLVDALVYRVQDDSTLIAVEVTVEVDDTPEEPKLPPTDPNTQTGSGAPANLPPVPSDPLAPDTTAPGA